ncbi:MAG: hypothetical protein ACE5R6_11120 [Candidatus Heimdallarchaeota archaeon]
MIKTAKPFLLTLAICSGLFNAPLNNRGTDSIPFVGMEVRYGFELQVSGWALPGGGFLYLKYQDSTEQAFFANVSFRLYLDPFTGTENATMIEDARTRRIFVNTTGTRYVAGAFFLLFDPKENATNRTPIWVFPDELREGNMITIGAYNFTVQNAQNIEAVEKNLQCFRVHFEKAGEIFRNYTALYESNTGLLISGDFIVSEDSSRNHGTLRLEETNIAFEQISFLRRNLRIILPVLFGAGIIGTAFIYIRRRRIEIEGGLDAD